MPHSHRSGGLKQSNKRNKRSKSSKRSLSRQQGGRVNVKQASANGLISQSKANRRHHQQQRRAAHKAELLQKRRGIGNASTGITLKPPRLVGILALGNEPEKIETRLQKSFLKAADEVVWGKITKATAATAKYETHKKDGILTFLTNSRSFVPHYTNDFNHETSRMMGALDLCRVCDVVLVVLDGNEAKEDDAENCGILGMQIGGDDMDDQQSKATYKSTSTPSNNWDHLITEQGDTILNAIKIQGLPTPLTVLCGVTALPEDDKTMKSAKSVRRSALKRQQDLHKYVRRFATTEFGDHQDKVMTVAWDDHEVEEEEDKMEPDDNEETPSKPIAPQDQLALIRTLCTMRATAPKWVSEFPRNFILTDSFEYNSKVQELRLQGFVRGNTPFDVNSLFHIPNMGTFNVRAVESAVPPLLPPHKKEQYLANQQKQLMSDPSLRPSLEMFAAPDALEGEQNLVGFEDHDFMDPSTEATKEKEPQLRPAGWSDYQSSWLDAIDEHDMEGETIDHGELAAELNQKKNSAVSIADKMDEDLLNISPEERKALINDRKKNQKDDLEFPDEVQVDEDHNARDRFARYRALKSFRKSFWDPKENLPDDYGQIYHFSSFRATQRDIMADQKDIIKVATEKGGTFWGEAKSASEAMNTESAMEDSDKEEDEDVLVGCIPSGSYVTVIVEHVPIKAYERISKEALLSAITLLPHENKASAIHMGLSQSPGCVNTDVLPVKSKDILTFRCGWRSWKARPVFSQNNLNSDKHKFERYLPTGGAFFAASVYGPVSYTPCPVMVFRDDAVEGKRELVAMGSVLSADADRIVVKRIILTGYPVKVQKRTATVKYMFYNPEDVTWFKPAGLTTKHGLNGHIVQSVGEHGTMKCLFNAPIKQHDTVCLPLYKRIYPKFANTVSSSGNEEVTVRSAVARDALLVL